MVEKPSSLSGSTNQVLDEAIVELIDSTDEGRSVRAYLLLRELETSPSVGNLAKSMVNDYIENAESEIVERIQQTERHREALND